MEIKISAIIVNYNAGERLFHCVRSIIEQVDEVIVIDNASQDSSLDLLNNLLPNEQIKIIRNKINLGFAKACNIGIKETDSPFLLFLNPDCVVEKNSMLHLMQVCQSSNTIGMVGPHILNPDGTEQAGGRRFIPTPWRSFVKAFGLTYLKRFSESIFQDFNLQNMPLPETPISVEAISGACMLVKREVIEDVGVFDEQYFLHCEDLDWCHRLHLHQWEIHFVPQAKLIHFQGTCSKNRPFFVEWHKHRGMIKYYRKFFKSQYPRLLMWLVISGVYFRLTLVSVIHFFRNPSLNHE